MALNYTIPLDLGPVLDHGGQVYNVRHSDFNGGAKGDGTTDDAVAIQAAINTANTAGGGCVFFPRGTYVIGTGLVWKDEVWLVGEVFGATIIKMKASTNIDMVTTTNYAAIAGGNNTIQLAVGIGARNLIFYGNRDNNTSGVIWKVAESGGRFEDVQLLAGPGDGMLRKGDRTLGTNFPYIESTHARPPESVYSGFSVGWCAGKGMDFAGPGDAELRTVFTYRNDAEGLVLSSVSSNIGYLHAYANNQTTGSYQVDLQASALCDRLEIRDGMEGGILISGDESLINQMYVRKNLRTNSQTSWPVSITGARNVINDLFQLHDASLSLGNHQVSVTGNFNQIRGGVINGVSDATEGLVIAGQGNAVTSYITGVAGPAVQITGGRSNRIDVLVTSCTTLLQKDGANANGFTRFRVDGAAVTNILTGTSQVFADTEFVDFQYQALSGTRKFARSKQLSADVAIDATGSGSVNVAHNLVVAPAVQDVQVTIVAPSAGGLPTDYEITYGVSAVSATNVTIAYDVKTAGAATGKIRFAVRSSIGRRGPA